MVRSRRARRVITLVLLTFLKVAIVIAQTTIHVPADAATVQAGIDLAQNGDTVLVSPGTYNENINFGGKAITVTSGAKSFADATTTIINATGDGPAVTFSSGETSSSILNGFTVTGGHTDASTCTWGGGIYISSASPILSNNVISSNVGYGVFVAGSSSPLIRGNDISGTHYNTTNVTECHSMTGISGGGVGIYLQNTLTPQIIGNTIENNITPTVDTGNAPSQGAGLVILGTQDLLLKNNIIRNNVANEDGAIAAYSFNSLEMVQNLVYGTLENRGGAIVLEGSDQTPTKPPLTAINNTIYDGGIELDYSFSQSIIENNIFDNSFFECGSQTLSSPIVIDNNDVFLGSYTQQYPCNLGSGNIFSDPQLLDPNSGDFHEQGLSPTASAGNINAPDIPGADLDAKARTVCGVIDMGVYQLRPHPPVAITSSANPAPGGSSLTFTAEVTGNCNVPRGTITFFDGSTSIGTATLNSSAIAIFSTAFLVVGTHSITAEYSGDFNFEASTSDVLLLTITGDPTTTSLSISPLSTSAFSPVTFTSTVNSQYGVPTGTVIFMATGKTLASAILNSTGTASVTVSTLEAGVYDVTANYTADTRFQPSTSNIVRFTINGIGTTTQITASPNPAALTQQIVFKAKVQASHGSTIPSGVINWLDGTSVLGTTPLASDGSASFSTTSLSFGVHTITAQYEGSQDFNSSSTSLVESVTLIVTTLSLTATPNPADTGQTVTLTAVASSAMTGMTPVGTVTFYDGNTVLGMADLSDNETAILTTSSLSVGVHSLSATLASGTSFGGSSSNLISEVIQAYDFSMAISPAQLTVPSGDYTNIKVTLSPVGGFDGSVSLSCDGVPDHTECYFPQDGALSLAQGQKTINIAVNTSDVYGYGKFVNASTVTPDRRISVAGLAAVLLPGWGLLSLIRRERSCKRLLHGGWIAVCMIGISLALCVIQGCSGKLPGKTTPGVYTILLRAKSTDGTLVQHSEAIQLTVTQ